jgi:hypothetical protein
MSDDDEGGGGRERGEKGGSGEGCAHKKAGFNVKSENTVAAALRKSHPHFHV